jgi:hypothetical protein
MGIFDPESLNERELFRLYGRVLDTLRTRETTRSANNPVADYAEGLCAKALNFKLATKAMSCTLRAQQITNPRD